MSECSTYKKCAVMGMISVLLALVLTTLSSWVATALMPILSVGIVLGIFGFINMNREVK